MPPPNSDKESLEVRIALIELGMKEARESLTHGIERTNLLIADEKDTRLLMNERWLNEMAELKKYVFIGMGIMIALQFITPVLLKRLKAKP